MAEALNKAEIERQFLASYRSWCKIMKKVKQDLDKEELTEEEIQLNIEDLNQSLNEFREVSLVTESILDEEDKITQHETFKSYEKETFELLNLVKVFRNKSKAPAEEEKPTCTNEKIDMAEVSSTSSRLSSASKRAERAAKVARLKTELSFVEAEAKAQAALNQLKIARELAATQAEINELDLQYNDMPVPTQPPDLPDCSEDMLHNYLDGQVTSLNPDAESYQPLQVQLPPITENLSAQKQPEDSMLKLANILTEKCLKESLPTPEPSVFKGDSLLYPIWKKNFETFIENRTTDPANRLFYLTRYTSGEAHEAIKSFSSLNTEEAFRKAKDILENRYGSPFMVANAYRRKIKDWAKILPDDGPGLRKFSDFLQSCLTAMDTVKYLAPLNDPEENQKMLKKLPSGLVNRWSRLADTRLQGTGDYPNFKDFCKFIETEARISCNPITSPNAIKENERFKNTKPTSHDNRHKAKTFQTGVQESHNSEKCFKCKKPHSLNDCPEFLKLSPIDRFYYCQEESICRGCMEWGHIKKDCTKKKVCKTCKKFHPTSLHKDNYIPPKSNYTNYKKTAEPKNVEKTEAKSMMTFSANTSSSCVNKIMSSSHTHSQIVPVKVNHEQDADHSEIVVCVIDDQSDTCFVDEQLKKDLHLEGPDVSLELSTMHGTQTIFSQKITDLEVAGLFENITIKVPVAYTRPFIPANESQIPRKETALKYDHLNQIANCLLPENVKIRVGMLIGINCIKAVKPVEVIPGEDDEPYGLKTALGWGIVGMVESSYSNEENEDIENMHNVCITSTSNKFCHFAFRTKVKEVVTVKQMNNLFDMDFQEDTQDKYISHEDTKFMDIMAKGIHQLENGQFEMPLPLRNPEMVLPDNKPAVLKRLNSLKKKLMKDDKYKEDYFKFMDSIIQNGYSEEIVTDEELKLEDGKIWYLPHFGTYHPRKPDKLRIVFDASISYNGSCLNNTLLQGPDLTNNLLGVLCRFRQERVAFICDIESMFFRFKVNREDRNFLRFFWWKDNDLTKEPSTYRMTVHLFGATSSPGCANFGLKSTAELTQNQYGKKAADFIKKDFYVDDGLKSVATIEEAKDLIDKTVKMCKSGGLKLHKFLSNKKEALEDLPVSARAKNIDVDIDDSQIDRALGVQWCIQNDSFQFRINLQDRPLTRRGILSTVSSVFDPLGLVSPCILIGKQILKELCKEQIGWDDEIPNDIRAKWTKWRSELIQLSDLKIQRSFCPDDFGTVKSVQIHHFSDGSLSGYGQCSYVKLQNENGRTHCTLALAKSRVSPSKTVTVPRIELAAAVVSVKVAAMLKRELTYENYTEYYWTDSRVLLGYIANEAKRFHIYVANRVQQIRNHSSPDSWHFIEGTENPADIASRGMTAENLVKCERWWKGPHCLYSEDYAQPIDIEDCKILNSEDPEVKNVITLAVKINVLPSLLQRFTSFSDWHKLKLAVSCCLRIQAYFKKDANISFQHSGKFKSSTVNDLKNAEMQIFKELQKEYFEEEIKIIKAMKNKEDLKDRHCLKERKKMLKTSSKIYKLDPFIDENGLLRVGGRIKNAGISEEAKHPIILPQQSHITKLLVTFYHERTFHQGRATTHNLIRASGFWLIGGKSVVSNIIAKCVTCKRLFGKTEVQKMASLPKDRLEASGPFVYSAVDYFGPFYVKEGRRELKRYGVIFVCMASRAIHLEVSNSMTTDSFLNAYRRFVCRRGPISQLRSDQGSNFIGAINELQVNLGQMDHNKISGELLRDSCDWIDFKMNLPESSHMGGSWERLIRSVRNVFVALLHNHGTILDDETLRTFMTEAESIVNCRPLSVSDINDPNYPSPITPNQLLTLKPQVLLPPPGVFLRQDVYAKKRWRRVQFLADQFWKQWSSDYLQNLQKRPKWTKVVRNFEIDDIVLIKDDNLPRNEWKMGRVCELYKSDDGLVRKVRIAIGDRTHGKTIAPQKYLDRPIHKLVMLLSKKVDDKTG